MEARCVRLTDLPQTSRLLGDFVYHYDRLSSIFGAERDFLQAASRIHYPDDHRAALVTALGELNPNHLALDLLARPGTVTVTTGQQVGLYSGPAYTVYKALTAARLARELNDKGIPAVAVFWLATEDHDFAEVNHCWAFDGAHRPARLEAQAAGGTGGPVGRIVVGQGPIEELRAVLGPHAFGEGVLGAVEGAYRPGQTLGRGFAELLKRLLAPYGLLFLDPLAPAVRELAAPILRRALEQAPELNHRLLERNAALEAAGYHAQVRVEPQSSLLFLFENGRRLPLARLDGDYMAGGKRYSPEELAARAPDLSPNALLRPVMQDSILPTAAYVGGPAEIAYLAQAQVLYEALLGRMPVVVARAGFTLLDARSDKLLRRYGLTLGDFFHGEEALRERIAARLVPESLGRVLEESTAKASRELDALSAEMARFDRTLVEALERSRRKVLYQFSKLERKAAREALRRNERAAQEAASLYGLICPGKHLQERLYSILPFLAKHGPDLLEKIYASIRLDCPDHQLLVV